MDVTEAIETRIELREFADESVEDDVKRAMLDAGRLAPSGKNLQHWRFILVDDDATVDELGSRSPSGGWVSNADFAIAICTDPTYEYNEIDAGRAATHIQLVGWEHGVGSRLYTVDQPSVRELLAIPAEFELTLVLGCGYPTREILGRKDREPLGEIAYRNRFGVAVDFE